MRQEYNFLQLRCIFDDSNSNLSNSETFFASEFVNKIMENV